MFVINAPELSRRPMGIARRAVTEHFASSIPGDVYT